VECTMSNEGDSDRTPDAFAFTDQIDVAQDTLITSNTVTISGIDDGTDLSIDVGEYSIGCMAAGFTSTAGTIDNDQTVCVRHTSANSPNTAINSVLTVGTGSDTFTTTTAADAGGMDTTPDMFTFVDLTEVELNTVLQSNTITVSGIDAPAALSVTGGSYSIGCTAGTFTADPGTVNNGDMVCVRHTSAATGATAVNTTLTIGGVADTFTSTTRADPPAGDTETVTDPSGNTVTLTSNVGNIENLSNDPNPPAGNTPPDGITFANGFFSFNITGLNNGDSVDITITLPAGSTPDTYYKFQAGGNFEFLRNPGDVEGAVINNNTITLSLVDGGLGDADGLANGTIVDPGAPGTTSPTATGGGNNNPLNLNSGGGGGCVLTAERGQFDPLLLLLALVSLIWLGRRRQSDTQ